MCMADEVYNAFHVAKVVKARKQHKCGECSAIIEPGDRYETVSALSEDDYFFSAKTCLRCVAARRWLAVECQGWLYGAVIEDLAEHWHESDLVRTAALGRLKIAGERGWRKRKRGDERFDVATIERWVAEALDPLHPTRAA